MFLVYVIQIYFYFWVLLTTKLLTMFSYKRTGLDDYLKFISQNSRKGIVNIYEHVTNKNSFLDLPDSMAPDRQYWRFVMTVKF